MYSYQEKEELAKRRINFGNWAAFTLLTLKKTGLTNEIILGQFHRMTACASFSNHWAGDNLRNQETGALYAANGTLWACGFKLLCPSCAARAASRTRKKLADALKSQKLLGGEIYQLITLTMPNPRASLILTREIFNKAWKLFRKRKYFIENIRGAAKGEEFTWTENGYHYHAHLLCISKFLNFQEFRSEWTDCVEIAFSKYNIPFEVNNRDDFLNVVIEKVTPTKNGMYEAIQKVCKYLTKFNSWEKISENDLIEIVSKKLSWRLFELTGSFRVQRNVNRARNSSRKTTDTILDKQDLSDGNLSDKSPRLKLKKLQRKSDWRKHIEVFGLESYQERLEEEVAAAKEYQKNHLRRKFLRASFKTLEDKDF